ARTTSVHEVSGNRTSGMLMAPDDEDTASRLGRARCGGPPGPAGCAAKSYGSSKGRMRGERVPGHTTRVAWRVGWSRHAWGRARAHRSDGGAGELAGPAIRARSGVPGAAPPRARGVWRAGRVGDRQARRLH